MNQIWDVVCGMQGDTHSWQASCEHKGRSYHFCCAGCRGAFERSPEYHLDNFKESHPDIEPGLIRA